MKTKDLKRRINRSKRITFASNKKLLNKFKREVINPLIRHLKTIPNINPNEVKAIANNLVYSSQIYFAFTEELFKLETPARIS